MMVLLLYQNRKAENLDVKSDERQAHIEEAELQGLTARVFATFEYDISSGDKSYRKMVLVYADGYTCGVAHYLPVY